MIMCVLLVTLDPQPALDAQAARGVQPYAHFFFFMLALLLPDYWRDSADRSPEVTLGL